MQLILNNEGHSNNSSKCRRQYINYKPELHAFCKYINLIVGITSLTLPIIVKQKRMQSILPLSPINLENLVISITGPLKNNTIFELILILFSLEGFQNLHQTIKYNLTSAALARVRAIPGAPGHQCTRTSLFLSCSLAG